MDPLLSNRAAAVHDTETERQHERWAHVHVNWSAVWIGALAAFCLALLIGLVGIAVGAHLLGPEHRVVDVHKFGLGALIFSVCGAFFALALGGWTASKIAGILHSEPAMIHGAIVWLVSVPMLLAASALGAGSFFGGWYAGLAGTPAWASANPPYLRPEPLGPSATSEEIVQHRAEVAKYEENVRRWVDETPKATRNGALGAVTALLIGLLGSVIGGWLASGEPMNFSHYRTRKPRYHQFA
jgi:uncharacterized membrane protein YeaQ/YmgE (transglycosylase-associated protein family)